jgi:PAS domain S-box-containing protein
MSAKSLKNESAKMLRKEAEQILGKLSKDFGLAASMDIQKLLFEFNALQVELEAQNDELNRTHKQLNASYDDFENIYNLSPIAYLTLDKHGIIKKTNIAAMQLLNGSTEGFLNNKLGNYIHSSDQDEYNFFIHDLVSGVNNKILNAKLATQSNLTIKSECPGLGIYGCSRAFCTHNSRFIYVELSGSVNRSNIENIQIYLAIQDITEHKYTQEAISCLNEKMERKIREQTSKLIESNLGLTKKVEELNHFKYQLWEREAKLNAIFNASIEGIITIDTSGHIVSTNAAVATIFGYSEAELIGSRFDKLMSTSRRKKKGREVKKYLHSKIPSIIDLIREVDGIRKDGSLVPLDISMVEFSIDSVNYFAGIVRDVSLRKHQEQQEKKHLEELAHVTRLCLMGEMGSGIAHEINQPLTAIANYTQASLRFIETENPDLGKLGNILFKIHKQALKAGQIIHRMKDFVSNRHIYRIDRNINILVEDAVSLCANDFKKDNIRLKLDLAENIPVVSIDDVQIEQVLLNLIRNSIDALKVVSKNTQRQLSIETRLINQNAIEVRVKDNGIGINEEQQKKILTLFYTTKDGGMGMGLSISRSIVEAHEGVFHFNSKPKKGTTFYFTLPLK